MVQLEWSEIGGDDLASIRALAERCMLVDGGLPSLATDETIRRFFANGPGILGRDIAGEVLAACALFNDNGQPTATGFVDPSVRGAGVGEELAAWTRTQLDGQPMRLLIENDTEVTEEFAHRIGLVKVYSEAVMRQSLGRIPQVPRPDGLTVEPWTEATAPLFHRAWSESFAERPGYVPVPLEEWCRWVESEPTFLPEHSRVVLDGEGPVGFVTVSTDWIDQAGVVPAWRGRGLGAHLMARSLTALKKAGSEQVWLCVTEDNPAHELYRSLGFRDKGMRARYAAPPTSVPDSPSAVGGPVA
jgi:GNAT superfamily N-acetyltransferase